MVYNWLKIKLSEVFSAHCLLCLSPTHNRYLLCSDCEKDLPINEHHCLVCAIPLSTSTLVCGKCQKNRPYYTTSSIPYIYASPVKQLITQLKFHGNLTYTPLLAHGFVHALKHRTNKLPECIIPVPLHKTRLRERGFNQALELSQVVGKYLSIPTDHSICQRNKPTPFQSGLSAKQRKSNLRNAFSITKAHQYKHVAIFDDVVTTGTTVNELALSLKKSGVEIVEVWALARTRNKNN